MSTKVLVVDDSAFFRRIVSEALAALPGVLIAGTAHNGKAALARLAPLAPDLVTLDIEMPEMNGIEVLEAMAAAGSKTGLAVPGVVVLSALTARGSRLTLRALELGAFDFITKPDGGSAEDNLLRLRQLLAPIVRAFERRREIREILSKLGAGPGAAPGAAPAITALPAAGVARSDRADHRDRVDRIHGSPIVLIGVSTGGPVALARLIPALPATLAAPVFIVQHMPPLFTTALAESLQTKSAIRVTEAKDGEIAAAGRVYIAPGGRQMRICAGPAGEIMVRLTDDPPERNCRPSVDYLFRSAALRFPGRSIAAILTGMGDDGTEGLRMLKRTGCSTIAQDEASCVVFGMPREAIEAGVIDAVVPLDAIAACIIRSVQERSG
jgi:two-component system chemotaxis response regulator CheB